MERENQKRKHRTRKKNHRLYALVAMLLTIAAVILVIFDLFYTQRFEVSGNDYCSTGEIRDAVLANPYEINTLYVLAKYQTGHGRKLACMDEMKVGLKNPWTLKVTVKEKPIIGYIKKGTKYAYFDKEGLVVKISDTLREELPSIEGVTIKNIKLYQKLSCDKSKIFEEILKTSRELKKYELTPDKIVYEKSTINLYIGDICVSLGNQVTSEQIAQIRPILEKLAGKKGTLHLEDYVSSGKAITFEKEKEENKADDAAADENTDDQNGGTDWYTWDGSDMNQYGGTVDDQNGGADWYTWDGSDTNQYGGTADDQNSGADGYTWDGSDASQYGETGWYDEAGNYYDSSQYDTSGAGAY